MDDTRVRHIPARPAPATGSLAKIDLLEVQEVAFIERPHLLEHFPPHGQACAGDPVAGMRPTSIRFPVGLPAQQASSEPELRTANELGQR